MFHFVVQRLVDRLAIEVRAIIEWREEEQLDPVAFAEMAETMVKENMTAAFWSHHLSPLTSGSMPPSAILFRAAIVARIREMKGDLDDPLRLTATRSFR